jgi:hypothetical protein
MKCEEARSALAASLTSVHDLFSRREECPKGTSGGKQKTLLEDTGAKQASLGLSQKSRDQPDTWLARRYVGCERYRISSGRLR